jgi:aflatoxin B1 aldehyde reductase
MSRPNTLFGGAMIGTSFTTLEQVQDLLDLLKTLGIDRIDTAARYSPTAPGSSERLLGETRAAEQGFTIDTKFNTASGDGAGNLTAAAIEKSLQESLSRLQMSKVNILHLHRPDPQTPVIEQAAEIHRHYLAGRFDKVFSSVL